MVTLKPAAPSSGLARALSKLGFCSRREAFLIIREGRVTVNGRPCSDGDFPVDLRRVRIAVDGVEIRRLDRVYLVLNKPQGLVTTTSDEQGRDTVYSCFLDSGLPRVFPVGRLDRASEGLLLFTNDTTWADGITDPRRRLEKIYHVQVGCLPSEPFFQKLRTGVQDEGEFLRVREVRAVRSGTRNSWLELTLTEGRNRHIRRMMQSLGVDVLQLVRIQVGAVQLGGLAKGTWRHLTPDEVESLRRLSRGGN